MDTVEDPLVAQLRTAGCVYAEEEALLLREAAEGQDLAALVVRRLAGVPLEVLLGWAEVAGVRVRTAPGVFVPRARSGLLVRLAVQALAGTPCPVVVDLGCGTGALGVAVAHHRPDAEVHASDVDPAAVACARLDLPGDRVHHGDLFDALPAVLQGRVDALVVNAPYVPTPALATMPPEAREHEPRLALDGGPEGLDVQGRVAAGAQQWLATDGVLVMETSESQAQGTAGLLAGAGLRAEVHRDEELDAVAVLARRT